MIENYNRGTIALQKGKLDKALQFFKRETNEFKELYLNMANTYRMMGLNEKAWLMYDRANSLDVLNLDGEGGEYDDALSNMGLLAYQEGSDNLASTYYLRALALNPLHYMTIWNYSLVLLRDYCSGEALHKDAWKMHEYRFKAVKAISPVAEHWDGVSHVSSIVVLNEQGIGDKLMYGRYLKYLSRYCDTLWVQCDPSLDYFFSAYKVCRTVAESGCTVGIPFGCLPEIFGTVPAEWLSCAVEKFYKYTVVVEWAGSSSHLNNKNRSCYSSYFRELAKRFPEVNFVNVRPDSEKVAGITKLGGTWEASAEIVAGADLVISVDTSLVHLAGSLGTPCYLLQPLADTDFRWGNPRTKKANGIVEESNIWYPSVYVIENTGWAKTFELVAEKLRTRIFNSSPFAVAINNKIKELTC